MFTALDVWKALVNVRPEVREYGVLHQAVYAGKQDVALKLVEVYGANLALRTRSGETVVQIAEKGGYLKLAAELSSRVEAKGAPATLL